VSISIKSAALVFVCVCWFVRRCLYPSVCVYVSVYSNRVCLNPILPHGTHKVIPPPPISVSKSQASEQTVPSSGSRVKRIIERKSYRAMLTSDLSQPASEQNSPKPDTDMTTDDADIKSKISGRPLSHKLFGRKKFASLSASPLKKLKHKTDRGQPGDGPWKKRGDPWRKRRSLLASDRTTSRGTRSPRRVPSSSSLASLSDSDASKNMSSQSRNLLKVVSQCLSNNTHHCYQQWSCTHYSTAHTLWALTAATILADAAVTSPSPK